MAMRGADGIGCSGAVPDWGSGASDARATGPGIVTIFRNLNDIFTQYGPWLTMLQEHDPLAIVVSGRMLRIDNWHSHRRAAFRPALRSVQRLPLRALPGLLRLHRGSEAGDAEAV